MNHDDQALITAWDRWKAGLCDWSEVQAEQNAKLPRCAAHGVPTSATIAGVPMCAACIAEAGDELRLWIKSQSLVSGGVAGVLV
jgi:hypothetical protein